MKVINASSPDTVTALAAAIRLGHLRLEYQPQVRTSDRTVIGFEALLRWRDPVLGEVAPSEFVPVAERHGLIQSIGLWAIEQACRQSVSWRAQGLPRIAMAVNVSPLQLSDASFPNDVEEILAQTRLAPSDLELEVTESTMLTEQPLACEALQQLRGLGVHLAIDDFGTGYSALALLALHAFDKLKLDRSFVRGLPNEARYVTLVQTIVNLAHELGLDVVAEGVENESQYSTLRRMRCDVLQGYLFAEPLAPLAVPDFVFGHLPMDMRLAS